MGANEASVRLERFAVAGACRAAVEPLLALQEGANNLLLAIAARPERPAGPAGAGEGRYGPSLGGIEPAAHPHRHRRVRRWPARHPQKRA